MRVSSLRHWACPRDGLFPLRPRVEAWRQDEIWRGKLECGACGICGAVEEGLPSFLPPIETSGLEDAQKLELSRRNQVLMMPRTGRQMHDERVEEEAVMKALAGMKPGCVLDAGCGAGRMSLRLLRQGHEVVALDFAAARLDYLRRRVNGTGRLSCAVADLSQAPLRPRHFDAIVCLQVLEHLPSFELRQALLGKLRSALRPEGRLVLSVYNYNRRRRREGATDGRHDSGIFYHCYTERELRQELHGFRLERLAGLNCQLPGAYRLLGSCGSLGRQLDRWLTRPGWVSADWAQLWLAVARA